MKPMKDLIAIHLCTVLPYVHDASVKTVGKVMSVPKLCKHQLLFLIDIQKKE
jgi:hypothetical protein